VVGFDVLDDLSESDRQSALSEIKRVLCAGGVTLHGIAGDEQTNDAEYAVGFLKSFQHVAYEPRYAVCGSAEDFLIENQNSGQSLDADLLAYLRDLSFKERRAFDMAMGYVFGKISDLNLSLPKSGLYVFLKAANVPLGPFYNEHRDRRALYAGDEPFDGRTCLDRSPEAVFDDGWYEPNMLPPVARWMTQQARVRFSANALSEISLDLTTHMPDVRERPLSLDFILNGETLTTFQLFRHGWVHLNLPVPERLAIESAGKYELEIRADRTWQPRPSGDESRDDREISIAVCNLEIRT
jgi:hypothetical protein